MKIRKGDHILLLIIIFGLLFIGLVLFSNNLSQKKTTSTRAAETKCQPCYYSEADCGGALLGCYPIGQYTGPSYPCKNETGKFNGLPFKSTRTVKCDTIVPTTACSRKTFVNRLTGREVTLNFGESAFIDGCKACGWSKCCDGTGGQPVGRLKVKYTDANCKADVVCVAVKSCQQGGPKATAAPIEKPSCASWSDMRIEDCNSYSSYIDGKPRCITKTVNVKLHIAGRNSPTKMKFINLDTVDVAKSCNALTGFEAGWSNELTFASNKNWVLPTGNGAKKVCVMLGNDVGWGTACGGMITLK